MSDEMKLETAKEIANDFLKLIRTGDWEFSKWIMGTKTREVGLRQREGYLWRGNERLSCPEEEDVFELLGMNFIEPKDRVFGEIKKQGCL